MCNTAYIHKRKPQNAEFLKSAGPTGKTDTMYIFLESGDFLYTIGPN